MPKKRNSGKKSNKNIQNIDCPHVHTHTLPQFGISTCFSCLMIYHNDCEYRKIEDSKEATQSIKILQTYLEDIKVTAQVNRFHLKFKTFFFDELNIFFTDLDLLNKRLRVAVQQNDFREFTAIKEEALRLMQKLDNTQIMAVYAKHRVHSLLDLRVNGGLETEDTANSVKSKSKDKDRNSEQEILSNLKEKWKGTPKDDYILLMENYAEKYKELESKVQLLVDTNKDLESKVKIFEEAKNDTEKRCLKL